MKPVMSLLVLALGSAPLAAFAQEPLPPLEAPPAAAAPAAPAPAPAPVPAPAPAPPPAAAPAPAPLTFAARPLADTSESPPSKPGPARLEYLRFAAGLRVAYLPDAGLDTFARTDTFSSFALDATMTLLRKDNLSLAAGLGWDIGSRSNGVRNLESSLAVHRFTVPIEARWHHKAWLYSFAKLAPGAALMLASVNDPSAPQHLQGSAWAFAGDASVGASFLLGPHHDMDKRMPRFWITPEVGWSFATSADVHVDPGRDAKDILGTDAQTNLGSLTLSGFFWRASVATTF